MAYKVSITTRITVTADTADEVQRICDDLLPPRPILPAAARPQLIEGQRGQASEPPGNAGEAEVPELEEEASQRAEPTPLVRAITAYLFDLEAAGRSKFSIVNYRQHLKGLARFLESQDGARHVAQISVSHLRAYLANLQAKGLKASTIRTKATVLSCFFNWCIQEGTIEENPMKRVRRPKKPCLPRPIFNEREFLAILAAAEHSKNPIRDKAILCLLLDTGMRTAELMSLHRDDYDPVRSVLIINGKGNKIRTVKMGTRCQAAFEAHLERTKGCLWNINTCSFISMIYRLGKKAGIKANPHKFRHTFANRFLDAGGAIDELQCLLGHSHISTTMIYTAAGQQERALKSHVEHSPLDAMQGGQATSGDGTVRGTQQ